MVVVHRLRSEAVEVERQSADVSGEPHFRDSQLHERGAPRLDRVRAHTLLPRRATLNHVGGSRSTTHGGGAFADVGLFHFCEVTLCILPEPASRPLFSAGENARQGVMRVATLYFVTDARRPGVSPAGIALKISSPRL